MNEHQVLYQVGIVKPKRPWPFLPRDSYGDILYCSDYVYDMYDEDKFSHLQCLPLQRFSEFPKGSLDYLQIDSSELFELSRYECPWTGNKYYWMMPIALLAKDVNLYRFGRKGAYEDFLFDSTFMIKPFNDKDYWITDSLRAFIGHGYTVNTLPSDGDKSLKLCVLKLSTGDFLVATCFLWYNK